MFNFIFDGKLGNILAPVLPSNQLYLAIQHHKNAEVQEQIGRMSDYELRNCSDSGYGAIHVACRYDNKFALNLILDKGIPVDLVDTSGNTPLHYASKYGNIDICRNLVDRKCSAAKRNSQNATPYDVAENHVVRQYLLPLQLSSEREAQEAAGIDPMSQYGMPPMMGNEYPVYSMGGNQSVSTGPEYPVYNMGVTQQQTQSIAAPEYPVYSLGAQPTSAALPPPVIPTTISAPEYPVYSIGTQPAVSNPPPVSVSNPPPVISNVSTSNVLAQNPPSISNPPPITVHANVPPVQVIPNPVANISTFASSNFNSALPSTLAAANIGTAAIVPPVPSSSSQFQHVPSYGGLQPPVPVETVHVTPIHIPQQQSSNFGNSNNNKRAIQPDGFHSSASDPVLQARYGHVKASINIAPPPTSFPTSSTAVPPQYGLYNNGINPTAPSNVFSRYVAYDVHTNSAIPAPAHSMPTSVYNQPPQYQHIQQPTMMPPNPVQMQQQFNNAPPPYRADAPPLPMSVQPIQQNRNIAVFNPATDDVIITSSTSSSVL